MLWRNLPLLSRKRGLRHNSINSRQPLPAVEPLEGRTLLSVTFGSPVTQGGAPAAAGMVKGDFNGDGFPDLAVASTSNGTGQVAIYINNGNGTFKAPTYLADPGSTQAYGLTTYSDPSGNGRFDLAVTNPLNGTITGYRSNGDGTFQAGVVSTYGTAQSGTSFISNIAAGPFGGSESVVVTDLSDQKIVLMTAHTDGTFTVAQNFTNNGQANFNPESIVTGALTSGSSAAIAYSQSGDNHVYVATWNGSALSPSGSYTYSGGNVGAVEQLAVGGISGTGYNDIVATTDAGYVMIVQNQGGGSFTVPSLISLPMTHPRAIAVGFFDTTSSRLDVAVMNASGDIAVAINTGNAQFTGGFDYRGITSGAPQKLIAGNFFGGSQQDLAFSLTGGGLTGGGGMAALQNGGTPTGGGGGGGGGGGTGNTTTSPLVGTFSGKLPTSEVSGIKSVINQTLTVTNSGTTTLKGVLTGTLFLSSTQNPNSGALGVPVSAAASKKINLKPHQKVRIPVHITSLPTGSSGTYYLMMQLTDPNGHQAFAVTSKAISVAPPQIDLTGSFAKVPATAKAGKPATATITVTNKGNVPAKGALPIFVYVSPTPTLGASPTLAGSKPFKVNIRPGKSVRITIPKLSLPAGTEYLVADLDPSNFLNDVNTANNTFATAGPVTVA